MSVRFILGGSGQGKTYHIMQEMMQRSQDTPGQKLYLIVPEQYSLQMQRDLVLQHPNCGYFHMDVLSFFRLAYLIFDEVNIEPDTLLEDLGVSMILKKIITLHQEELLYFKKSMRKQGFLDELKSMIMEFISYGVTPEKMDSLLEKMEGHGNLSRKCQELNIIYAYFKEEIQNQYMVMEEVVEMMTKYAGQSEILKNGIFYFDGFTGFTPIQLKFLEKLMVLAKEVVCSVTIPYLPFGNSRKDELFHFSEKTVEAIVHLCKKTGSNMEDPVFLQEEMPPRYANREMRFLEQNLLRLEKEEYIENLQHIHMISCETPEEEADFILHKAEELVREKGIRYRDIAVLTASEEEYLPAFLRQASFMHIPLFVDVSRKMTYQAGAEAVRALFHLAASDYSYESVFRYLKSGMSNMEDEDVDFLENYVLEAGIRGYSMWSKPFSRRFYSYDEEQQSYLEELRQKVMEETEQCCLSLRDARSRVAAKLETLRETLLCLHYQEKFERLSEEAEERGKYDLAREYQQFYTLLLDLIEKTQGIFGDEYFTVEELAGVMDAGLESLGITVAPLSLDQLIIGDMKRSRLPEIKVLFIAGVNDGYLPPLPVEKGLLSDDEKEILGQYGIDLSMSCQEQVLENDFYMYLAFTKPSEEIYFTYADRGNEGSARRESELLHHLQKIFPALQVKRYPEEIGKKYVNWQDSKGYLCDSIKNYREQQKLSRGFLALLQYGLDRPEMSMEMRSLWDTWQEKAGFQDLNQDLAEELFGQKTSGSATRFEQFMQCPYQFFCHYGMDWQERKEYRVSGLDFGNALHRALEYFSKKIKESEYTWKSIPKEWEELWEKEAIEASIQGPLSEILSESARNHYKKEAIYRLLCRSVTVIREQLKNSDFEPDHFELHFGGNGTIQGVIDRVDRYEEEDSVYLKIIDYKSGNKEFDLNQVYYGLQMQLLVYMNAAIEQYGRETGKKVIPAGIYYYQIKDPILKLETADAGKILKEYQLSGYSNSDVSILRHIENTDKPISIPVSMKKDGTPAKTSKIMDTDDFYALGDHIKEQLQTADKRIRSGHLDARPVRQGQYTACQYCNYHTICGFDPRVSGFAYQELEKRTAEDILQAIRK